MKESSNPDVVPHEPTASGSTLLSGSPSADRGDAAAEARILIVDDFDPTARAVAALVATVGYRSAVFHRANDALDYVSRNPCLAAIVDIHLPDMSGIVLAQLLRAKLGPCWPIVVLSGDTSIETLNSLATSGATHFFSKPVNSSQLLERLKAWIDESTRAVSSQGAN